MDIQYYKWIVKVGLCFILTTGASISADLLSEKKDHQPPKGFSFTPGYVPPVEPIEAQAEAAKRKLLNQGTLKYDAMRQMYYHEKTTREDRSNSTESTDSRDS